jgi:hypothetical protein
MLQNIISYVLSHETVFVGFGVALLDLLFALVPAWQSNGVLHWIYLQLKSLVGGAPAA